MWLIYPSVYQGYNEQNLSPLPAFAYVLSNLPKSFTSLFVFWDSFFFPLLLSLYFQLLFPLFPKQYFLIKVFILQYLFSENWSRQRIVDLGFCTVAQHLGVSDWTPKWSWHTYTQVPMLPACFSSPKESSHHNEFDVEIAIFGCSPLSHYTMKWESYGWAQCIDNHYTLLEYLGVEKINTFWSCIIIIKYHFGDP